MRSVDELKTVFLATASHELRTPVSAITGYAQILATSWDTLSPEEAHLFAEQIDSNAQRLASLVEDLLDFSRLERGAGVVSEESVLDLGDVVTRILEEQPDLAPDHQVLHQTVPGIGVVGSVQAVERVLSNLVGNAAKYSPAGTVIRVVCNVSQGSCDVDGNGALRGCGWYVEVQHEGDVVTRYCHLVRRPPVAVGQPVSRGAILGHVGTSGSSSGPHLHFEVHAGVPATRENAVSPSTFFKARGLTIG
jgi:signal transduction histidine kinase